MADERARQAIMRIEAALARIEAAATRGAEPNRDDERLHQLRASHQALRGKVEEAIGQIDRMLASGGGG